MSTVLWANRLVEGKVESDQSDKPALHKHADKLDAIARKLGLGSFLAICDTTDARFNTSDIELPAGCESTNDVMAREGAWIDAAQAEALLAGLLEHVRQHKPRFGLLSNDLEQVTLELSEALAYARGVTAPGTRFNFAVVI